MRNGNLLKKLLYGKRKNLQIDLSQKGKYKYQ